MSSSVNRKKGENTFYKSLNSFGGRERLVLNIIRKTSVGWWLDQLVGWSVCWISGRSVDLLVGRSINWLVDRSINWLVGRLFGRGRSWSFAHAPLAPGWSGAGGGGALYRVQGAASASAQRSWQCAPQSTQRTPVCNDTHTLRSFEKRSSRHLTVPSVVRLLGDKQKLL